jgi:hypothetical protein
LPFRIEASKEAMKTEAAISYELYRVCVNAIQADDFNEPFLAGFFGAFEANEEFGSQEEFGQPHPNGKSILKTNDFRFMHVIPEFQISKEDRVDLLITAEYYKNFRPFILFECKRRPFQMPGPSYARALYRQGMRYASKLDMQYLAVYDGWVIILAKRSYPFLLGIFDATMGGTLTPQMMRDLLAAVRELEDNKSTQLKQLIRSSRPKDPEFISRRVLPSIGKELVRGEKEGVPIGETEKGKIDHLVNQWRKEILLV